MASGLNHSSEITTGTMLVATDVLVRGLARNALFSLLLLQGTRSSQTKLSTLDPHRDDEADEQRVHKVHKVRYIRYVRYKRSRLQDGEGCILSQWLG